MYIKNYIIVVMYYIIKQNIYKYFDLYVKSGILKEIN